MDGFYTNVPSQPSGESAWYQGFWLETPLSLKLKKLGKLLQDLGGVWLAAVLGSNSYGEFFAEACPHREQGQNAVAANRLLACPGNGNCQPRIGDNSGKIGCWPGVPAVLLTDGHNYAAQVLP